MIINGTNIDVNTEGSYRLHLDFILEMATTDNGLTYHFQENESSITLTILDKREKEVYKHETPFLDKRRCIEAFIINIAKKALIQ